MGKPRMRDWAGDRVGWGLRHNMERKREGGRPHRGARGPQHVSKAFWEFQSSTANGWMHPSIWAEHSSGASLGGWEGGHPSWQSHTRRLFPSTPHCPCPLLYSLFLQSAKQHFTYHAFGSGYSLPAHARMQARREQDSSHSVPAPQASVSASCTPSASGTSEYVLHK